MILKGGDFVYVPAGAIHVISNASATEEASSVADAFEITCIAPAGT